MNYQFFKPSPILIPYIRYYWVLESNPPALNQGKYRILPHGCTEISLFYGAPMRYYMQNGSVEVFKHGVISGQQTGCYDVEAEGRVGILSVMFTPVGIALFFNQPVSKFYNRITNFNDLGKEEGNLLSRITSAETTKERICHLEQYFIERINEEKLFEMERMAAATRRINQSRVGVNVEELAGISCLSTKQFQRKFTATIGTTPKHFMRTVRFQHALFIQQNHPSITLTQLAYKVGYYDQAHFINDFKRFTGMTPTQFLKSHQAYSDYFS